MKDFKSWGVKIRTLKDYNYRAIWMNLKTVRFGESIDDVERKLAMKNILFIN